MTKNAWKNHGILTSDNQMDQFDWLISVLRSLQRQKLSAFRYTITENLRPLHLTHLTHFENIKCNRFRLELNTMESPVGGQAFHTH